MEQQVDSYLDLVFSMFNQYVFQDCKNNIDDLTIYYRTNPATSGNPLIEELLKSIKDYPLESIGIPLFNSILAKSGKSAAESKEILDKIIEYKKYNRDKIRPIQEYIKNVLATVYLGRANRLYSDKPADMLTYIKNLEFRAGEADYLNSINFSNIDINSIIARSSEAVLTSSMDFVNEAFSEGAFKPGDIVVYSASPSNGKSLFAEAEALHIAIDHKERANMLVMGDISMDALLLRLAAIYSGLPFKEARLRLNSIFTSMKRDINGNLDIIVAPAGVISASDYVSYVIESKKNYKACFIDYDENFKMSSRENMYNDFGEMYNEFTKLKDAGILTYVLCQPKAFSWSNGELIRLEDLGTSSRKGHIADVVITRSKEPGNLNGLGVFYIAKNRHGQNSVAYSIRLQNGRFKVIPKAVYDDLKQIQEQRMFTESELDYMASQYETQKSIINKKVESRMAFKGATPFN